MKLHSSCIVPVCAALFLSGCGGGDAPSTSATSGVSITAGNQASIARAAVNGGLSLTLAQGEVGEGSTLGPLPIVFVPPAALRGVVRAAIASASAHPQAVSSQTNPCTISGSLVTSWNDADGNGQLSAGDVLTATFTQCRDSALLAIDGTLTITITTAPSATQFAANATFQGLAAAYAGTTYTMNGAVALTETDTSTLSSMTFTVGSAGLTLGIASASYNDAITFDAGMVEASTSLASSSSMTLAGSFVAQSLGGRVTIATPSPLVQAYSDSYPGSGQVRITGAGGSTLLVTALDASQVQLQLDANGDGTVDGTSTVAWTTLMP